MGCSGTKVKGLFCDDKPKTKKDEGKKKEEGKKKDDSDDKKGHGHGHGKGHGHGHGHGKQNHSKDSKGSKGS